MIRFREEGQLIRQGFNIYPFNSKTSIGFILRIGQSSLKIRYSKIRKCWFNKFYRMSHDKSFNF